MSDYKFLKSKENEATMDKCTEYLADCFQAKGYADYKKKRDRLLHHLVYLEQREARYAMIVALGGQCKCGQIRLESLTLSPSGEKVLCYNCLMIAKREPKRISKEFEKFLAVYGCKCACCGESDPLALTMDHINEDGKIDRTNQGSAMIIKKAVLKPDFDEYQTLCWSCNRAKSLNGGVCPHQVKYI